MKNTRIGTGIARLAHPLARLLRDRRGVTAIEYGLIASAIAVALAASVITIGQDVSSYFGETHEAIESHAE
jgi:Flp pilus assembly pilin Flp